MLSSTSCCSAAAISRCWGQQEDTQARAAAAASGPCGMHAHILGVHSAAAPQNSSLACTLQGPPSASAINSLPPTSQDRHSDYVLPHPPALLGLKGSRLRQRHQQPAFSHTSPMTDALSCPTHLHFRVEGVRLRQHHKAPLLLRRLAPRLCHLAQRVLHNGCASSNACRRAHQRCPFVCHLAQRVLRSGGAELGAHRATHVGEYITSALVCHLAQRALCDTM